MAKVTREVAEQEISDWLDFKKIFPSEREKHKESIDLLIDVMVDGVISIDDQTHEVIHKLIFPLESVTELKYKPRINDKMVQPNLKGMDPKDIDMRLLAIAATAASQPKGLLAGLDSVDKKIMMANVVFFL